MRLICEYCNGRKKTSNYLWDLHATIAMDVKNQQLFTRPKSGYWIFEMALCKGCRNYTMFILIFVNPRKINVTYSYGAYLSFDSYI